MQEAEYGKVQLAVGDRCGTFEDLEACISRFSAENCVQLWKRDPRTIAAAKNRVGKLASKMSESLKDYQLRYCCIHGGTKFISTNKSARKSSTFKRDCSFNIYIAAEKEGKFLEVRSLDLTHNHPVDQELFRHLPQQRRLAPELQNKARELMKMKANKMMYRADKKAEGVQRKNILEYLDFKLCVAEALIWQKVIATRQEDEDDLDIPPRKRPKALPSEHFRKTDALHLPIKDDLPNEVRCREQLAAV
ncbi:hypothetical protein MRX96_018492 [Rhipicephalus microplus]